MKERNHLDVTFASPNFSMKYNPIAIFLHFSFRIKKLCLMAKIEWEKRLISQFLDVIPKSFQVRRVCAKIIDNNPYPFFVSKVAY